jgi:hypothetical protein
MSRCNQNVQRRYAAQRAAMAKIGTQFDALKFEHRLVLAILNRAVIDLTDRDSGVRRSALRFLRGPMSLVDLCGVDPTWVRETLIKKGVKL